MSQSFWKFFKGILLRGESTDPVDNQEGSVWYNSTDDKLKGYLDGSVREVVTNTQVQTLTNKTIDGDDNTVQDLALSSLKTVLADADKVLQRDASGVVVSGPTIPSGSGDLVTLNATQTLTNKTIDGDNNTVQDLALTSLKTDLANADRVLRRDVNGVVVSDKASPSGDFVGTSDSQTLTNKIIDGDTNTVQDLALSSLKTNLSEANNVLTRDGSGAVVSTKANPTGDFVGTTDTQTLTNKTIDADLNTIINIENADIKTGAAIDRNKLANGTGNHVIINDGTGVMSSEAQLATSRGGTGVNSTATFPTTGVVVTRDATETLTNKTLTTPTVTTGVFDDGLDLIEETSFSNPASGRRRFGLKTDGKLYLRDSSGNEKVVGEGSSGGINYITNPDAEANTTGWATYADAAGTAPVDGTGGTANITWTRTTTTPLRGTGSFLLTKDAANRQGQGASFDFTIDRADRFSVLEINFRYEIASGTYADGDVRVYIYDVTNAQVIEPAGVRVLNSTLSSQQKATFQTTGSTSYRLIFHVASTSASAYTLELDAISVGPQVTSQGAFIGDWQSYTPTFTGSGGNPTLGNSTVAGRWRRVGDSAEVDVYLYTGTTFTRGVGRIDVSLPPGLSIDGSKLAANSATGVITLGSGRLFSTTLSYIVTVCNASSATTVAFIGDDDSTRSTWDGTPFTFTNSAADQGVVARFTVPIVGWSSAQVLSSETDTRVVAASMYRATNQTGLGPNNSYVKVNIDTVLNGVNTHGGVNAASNRIDIAVPGIYEVHGEIILSSTNVLANAYGCAVYRNGSLVGLLGYATPAVSTSFSVGGTMPITCNAGDFLELYLFGAGNNSVSTLTALGNFATRLTATRLSGPAQIAATDTVAARYTTTAGQSIANGATVIVDFGTRDFDSTNSVTTGGSWRFTAPVSGTYSVTAAVLTASASFTAGNALPLSLHRNNSATPYSYLSQLRIPSTGTNSYQLSGTDEIRLLAGETVDIRFAHGESTSRNLNTASGYNYVSIKRIGNY